jgi:serine/threonine protein kinase
MSQLFADRYTLIRRLGSGSFGVVHLAQDTRLRDRAVAIKVLHPQLSVDDRAAPVRAARRRCWRRCTTITS